MSLSNKHGKMVFTIYKSLHSYISCALSRWMLQQKSLYCRKSCQSQGVVCVQCTVLLSHISFRCLFSMWISHIHSIYMAQAEREDHLFQYFHRIWRVGLAQAPEYWSNRAATIVTELSDSLGFFFPPWIIHLFFHLHKKGNTHHNSSELKDYSFTIKW